MKNYLEKKYILKALNFYNISDKEEILNTLELINNSQSLQEIVKKFHDLLFVSTTDYYKKIKKFDNNKNNRVDLNKIIILTGYTTHLQNIIKRKFDLYEIEKHIKNIHEILIKDIVSFDNVEWAARFIRGVIIEIGPLQYEVMNEVPSYLVLNDKEYLIKIHIPTQKKLSDKDVINSLNKSDELLEKYYRNINTNNLVYYTESWLLSPELEKVLPKDSNILKFQKHFKLIALKENNKDFNKFVFKNNNKKNTTLQINLQNYLEINKVLHIGIGLLTNNNKSLNRI